MPRVTSRKTVRLLMPDPNTQFRPTCPLANAWTGPRGSAGNQVPARYQAGGQEGRKTSLPGARKVKDIWLQDMMICHDCAPHVMSELIDNITVEKTALGRI